jgi:hypothetical protein
LNNVYKIWKEKVSCFLSMSCILLLLLLLLLELYFIFSIKGHANNNASDGAVVQKTKKQKKNTAEDVKEEESSAVVVVSEKKKEQKRKKNDDDEDGTTKDADATTDTNGGDEKEKKKAKKAKKETTKKADDDEAAGEDGEKKEKKPRKFPKSFASFEDVCKEYTLLAKPEDKRKVDDAEKTKDFNKWNFYEFQHKETGEITYMFEDAKKKSFKQIPATLVKKCFEKEIHDNADGTKVFVLSFAKVKEHGKHHLQSCMLFFLKA